MLKTLVITSCTGEKLYKPENQLKIDDFRNNLSLIKEELEEYKCSASKMYTGRQHKRVMEAIELLRNKYGQKVIDLSILSAGYGLIDEYREIVPYEVTFNNMNTNELKAWSDMLRINDHISKKIQDYDLVFFLLGEKYLESIQLPLKLANKQLKLIFFASKATKRMIPGDEPYYRIELTQEDTKEFGAPNIELKGFIFKLLAQEIVEDQMILNKIYENPPIITDILKKYRNKKPKIEQLSLFPNHVFKAAQSKEGKQGICMTNQKLFNINTNPEIVAKNYGNFELKYFMPDNDDRVDPNFNFLKDEHSKNRDPYEDDFYAHEIFEVPNYDGVLVSMMNINPKKKLGSPSGNKFKKVLEKGSIHDYLRISRKYPILGDCGAYSYKNEYEPPYTTEEILNIYENLGFNIGVSIDHVINSEKQMDQNERKRRLQITERNAEAFISLHKEGNYTFKPSGIAQGWDVESYVHSVQNLIDMGYKHISLGGLAHSPTNEIFDILSNIAPIIPEDMEIHLFGASRLEILPFLNKLGVTSFDSTSWLRKAWMSSNNNYLTVDGTTYAAIRIPEVVENRNPIKDVLMDEVATIEELKNLEKAALKVLREFDKGQRSIDETLKIVLEYDEVINYNKKTKHCELYRKVLEDAPWKKCNCIICRTIGIEVIIFRGNNRNRRRGFHNTYAFYQQFKKYKQKG